MDNKQHTTYTALLVYMNLSCLQQHLHHVHMALVCCNHQCSHHHKIHLHRDNINSSSYNISTSSSGELA